MDKKVSDSYTEQVHVLTMGTLNGYNRLFGGKLMAWIDEVAAVVARRHSSSNVTTASIDNLEFKKAAYANDTLVLKGKIRRLNSSNSKSELLETMCSPGLWILVIVFIIRVCYH